jgi:hypothetical protein
VAANSAGFVAGKSAGERQPEQASDLAEQVSFLFEACDSVFEVSDRVGGPAAREREVSGGMRGQGLQCWAVELVGDDTEFGKPILRCSRQPLRGGEHACGIQRGCPLV